MTNGQQLRTPGARLRPSTNQQKAPPHLENPHFEQHLGCNGLQNITLGIAPNALCTSLHTDIAASTAQKKPTGINLERMIVSINVTKS